jgi:NDP-sugar pyrophosphorylase family protein
MDVIVMAGGIPKPDDPLYEYTQGQPKALLDIAGKPMVQWVLDALAEAESIDQVVLISLSEESGLEFTKRITYIPDQGGLLQNVRAGIGKVFPQLMLKWSIG